MDTLLVAACVAISIAIVLSMLTHNNGRLDKIESTIEDIRDCIDNLEVWVDELDSSVAGKSLPTGEFVDYYPDDDDDDDDDDDMVFVMDGWTEEDEREWDEFLNSLSTVDLPASRLGSPENN